MSSHAIHWNIIINFPFEIGCFFLIAQACQPSRLENLSPNRHGIVLHTHENEHVIDFDISKYRMMLFFSEGERALFSTSKVWVLDSLIETHGRLASGCCRIDWKIVNFLIYIIKWQLSFHSEINKFFQRVHMQSRKNDEKENLSYLHQREKKSEKNQIWSIKLYSLTKLN